LDILKNLGESSEQVSGLNSLAWIHQHLGDLEKAEGLRREVLDLVELLGDRHHLADQTANLAFTLVWRGKFSEADQWAEKSLCLGQEYGRWGDEGYLRLAIGFTSLYAGNYEKAQEELSQALAQTREIGSQGVRATVHWSLGCLALVRNSYQEAEAEFITSRQLYQQVQDNFLGLALSGLSYAYYFMEDRIKTRQNIVASLKFALSLKDYMHIVVTLPIVALFLSDIGELRRAIQIWELARTQPFIAKSSWHKQVVEPHILAVVSDLSSQEVEIARSFEQEMTLWETAEILLGEIELVNDPFLSEIS
jgi:tetratricopeptide (TPR) repeat protein